MGMFKSLGLFVVIPASVLLTLSFFVLFTIRKAETQALKTFGYVVAAVLWIVAATVSLAGVYIFFSGGYPMAMTCPMQKMMGGAKHEMCEHKYGMMSNKGSDTTQSCGADMSQEMHDKMSESSQEESE